MKNRINIMLLALSVLLLASCSDEQDNITTEDNIRNVSALVKAGLIELGPTDLVYNAGPASSDEEKRMVVLAGLETKRVLEKVENASWQEAHKAVQSVLENEQYDGSAENVMFQKASYYMLTDHLYPAQEDSKEWKAAVGYYIEVLATHRSFHIDLVLPGLIALEGYWGEEKMATVRKQFVKHAEAAIAKANSDTRMRTSQNEMIRAKYAYIDKLSGYLATFQAS